jgi:TRAP-type C4-dicarboxylate transport system permease small subunit
LFSIGVLMVGGTRLVTLVLELGQRSAALGVPLGWIYAVLPLSGTAILLYCLCAALGDNEETRGVRRVESSEDQAR